MTSIKDEDLTAYKVKGRFTILQLMTILVLVGIAGDLLLRWVF